MFSKQTKLRTVLTQAFVAALFLMGVLAPAHAAVVVANDTVFGPGSVLRDSGANLDYLRLDKTMGYGYTGVAGALGAGGDFSGWSIASSAQMLSLGGSLSLTQGATDISQLSMAGQVRDWFCPLFTCVNTSTTHVYARGLVSDLYTDGIQHLAFSIGERFNVSPAEVDFRISGQAPVDATGEEVFLVRVVPLPAAVWLFGSGLLGLIGVARRKAVAG
jgi:hypothetical protein